MSFYINIIAAAVLSLWAIALAFSGKQIKTARSRTERFFIFILATGLFQTGGAELAGINFSAIRLGLWLSLAFWILLHLKPFILKKLPMPSLLYFLFLLWAFIELFRSPDLDYGFRVFAKLLYPFAVMLMGYVIGRQSIPLLRVWLPVLISSFFIFLIVGGFTEQFFPFMTYAIPDLFWNRAAIADHAAVMVGICMAFAVAYAWQHRRILYLTGWFWISSFFVVNRTGILGSFGALAGFVLNRYRIKSLPIIAGLFMAGLAIFMYIDTLRQHLFDNPYKVNPVYYMKNPLQIDIQNIDDSGRFEIWEIVMERFFRPNPLIGSGLGSTQNWFYTIDYTRIKVEHSSYVRLLCDTGLIGCGLYVASLLSFIIIALKPIKREKNKDELFAQYAVCGSVAAIICCMGFDNIINYQLAANQYPFAIGGIYLGLIDKPVKANGDNEQWPVLSEENRTVQNQTRRTLNSY